MVNDGPKIGPLKNLLDPTLFNICICNCKIVNSDNLENVNIRYKGGVLCDNVGLGKTFSMLSLVIEN